MVGCYLTPCKPSTLESVVTEISPSPRGADILVVSNLNKYLEFPDRNKRDKAITSEMATEGLKDMTEHLLTCKLLWTRDSRMWTMLCLGQEVRSQTDCIIGTDLSMFQNMAVRKPGTTQSITWS